MCGSCAVFIWIQLQAYNPPPRNLEMSTRHPARCFMCCCRCCEVLQLKKDMQMDSLVFLIHGANSRLQVSTVLVINPNWSECHSNPSIVLLHASNFYSMEVYNRGIISIKWPWRWDSIKHFSISCLPHSQENVSASEVGTWFPLEIVRKERGISYLYF